MPQLSEIDILLWKEGASIRDIIGVYTRDEEGQKTLNRVRNNMERVHPERQLGVHTFCTNIPNR